MKLYQKLTLITAILGLVVPLLGVFAYVFINSLTGIPVLALFLGTAVLIAILIIAINIAALVVVFYIKNTRLVGIILISCGALLFLTVQIWGVPGLVLYIVSGIIALREKPTPPIRKYTIQCLAGCSLFAMPHCRLTMARKDFAIDSNLSSGELMLFMV